MKLDNLIQLDHQRNNISKIYRLDGRMVTEVSDDMAVDECQI